MIPTQARSRATWTRILDAARSQFAQAGYDRTTIRTVAAAADADPALVMRYFGNKDGLFAAASTFDLRLPDLSTVATNRLGETLIRHFLTRWEGDPNDQSLKILLRAGVTNQDAAARIRALFTEQVLPTVRLVAPDQWDMRAGLISTQIIGLAVCRFILAVPPIVDMHPQAIVGNIGPTLQRYLTGSLTQQTQGASERDIFTS